MIKEAGEYHGIDPLSVGVVLYQETYWGIFAEAKDKIANVVYNGLGGEIDDFTDPMFSLGKGQIQLQRAAKILGLDVNKSGLKSMLGEYLKDDRFNIFLTALNIATSKSEIGRQVSPELAGYYHNLGSKGFTEYLEGNYKGSTKVPDRLGEDIDLIRRALTGDESFFDAAMDRNSGYYD